MSRVAALVIAMLLTAFPVGGQPRDNIATPGTSILRGRVVAADTGQPLRRAQIRIVTNGPGGNNPPKNRVTATDSDGRYEFKAVAAGRYTVSATKGSYITLSYGQRRPNEPGKPLEILDGQLVEKVDFALPRGAVLTGRILDEFGEPAESIQVSLMPARSVGGKPAIVAGRFATTNDLGEFRMAGVAPGLYYLLATGARLPSDFERDDRVQYAYAATYYPGTASPGEARRLAISAGQTLSDLTMALATTRAARITGVVLDPQGRPMSLGSVVAAQRNGFGLSAIPFAAIQTDGSFQLSGLGPGEYVLTANLPTGFANESATAFVTVAGQDVDGIQLFAARASTLTGRVVTADDADAQHLRPADVVLGVVPKEPLLAIGGVPSAPTRVNEDGTFAIKSRPGAARLMIANLLPNWTVKAVRLNGVDVTDAGFDVRANEDVGNLEVELTNRASTLVGFVMNSRGMPVKDYSAIVFSQDRERWTEGSRYFSTGRPDQDGRYKISGLPAGEYFAIAVDSIDPDEASAPDFLERASAKATRFSLSDDEARTLDLKLAEGL